MKTSNENKKTNGRPNVKTYFQHLMMLMVAIMVSTALVGCDETNGGGGTQTNSPIIGTWVYGVPKAAEWTIEEWTKKNFLYGTAVGLYEFKANGTYLYRIRSYNTYSDTYIQHQGKFRVEGNKITVFERTENYMDFDYPKDNYQNKSIGERSHYFQSTKMSNGNDAIFIENTLQDLEKMTKWYWEKVK